MKVLQKVFRLPPFPRGFHLIDDIVYSYFEELGKIKTGMLHLFIKHTSASLALGENADSSVRIDLENYFTDSIDEKPYFTHTLEGSDDMPAHIKSIIIGASLTIPVTEGKCNLGVWQGIYLCEHRNYASGREIVMTFTGE
jgi:secondary thiamine-phosphate synthase enzyme